MGHPVVASPYTKIPRPANKRIYKHGNSKQVEKAADKQPVNELKMPRPANYVVASPYTKIPRPANTPLESTLVD